MLFRSSLVNSGYFTIRKGDGVEARRLMRVFVEPEADRVFWFHVRVLVAPIHFLIGAPEWVPQFRALWGRLDCPNFPEQDSAPVSLTPFG